MRRAIALAAICLTTIHARAAESLLEASKAKMADLTRAPTVALASFLDSLPDLVDQGLPSFAPQGALRLYFRPRFGDLLHEDYFRINIGAREKLSELVELNAELGTYFTHGLRHSVGNGLYQFRIGAKYEFADSPNSGWSFGLDFITPLSRPPYEITDGLRHTMPYATYTRTVSEKYGVVGFATLGLDLLDHTSLPLNFSENELHGNSTILTVGAARQWKRMNVILRIFDRNTVLLSNRSENAFGFRPSLGIPFLRRPNGSPRATATFEGRAIWGPDGFEKGINTSVRLDIEYRRVKIEQ
jgi:hypothetical protein